MTARHETPRHRSRRRILVVEDGLVHQKLATRLLERQGYEVMITSNGEEAVDALATQGFDLVLMDVEMPVMDGLTATSIIRDRESDVGGHIAIVALTSTADREQCLAAGMDGYILKPLRVEMLNETMIQILGN